MEKLRKGDKVFIISGKDKGWKGEITAVQGEMLLIDGANVVKKHVKANPNINEKGGIKTKSMPLHRSKVMILNPSTGKPDRVGIRVLQDGRKVRYFKSTNEEIEV